MGNIQLVQLDNEERTRALEKLGYLVDEQGYVRSGSTKKNVVCPYSDENVHISLAGILPGSVKVINANPFTMAQYFAEYGN